jgi:hypothetical protein
MSLHAAAALLFAAAGLAALQAPLRAWAPRGASLATGLLLLLGTGLLWAVFPATDAAATAAFLLSALAVAWIHRPASRRLALLLAGPLLATALAVALGRDALALGVPRPADGLFSSRHGLLFWNPLLWAGVAGLALSWRRDRRRVTALFAALAGVLLVMTCRPPAASGPWAASRWTVALPLLAPGIARALDLLPRLAARRPDGLLAAAAASFIAWNLLLMEQYGGGLLPRDGTVSFVAVAEHSAALLSRRFGSPPAWPANWAFAWRHGLAPDRFDLVAGKRLPAGAGGRPEIDVGDLALDAALLLEGWSVRHPCGEAVCRAVEGRARLLAPLAAPEPFALTVRASGEGVLRASVNGVEVGARTLGPEAAALRFAPLARPERLNEVSLTLGPGGRALVDRVTLEAAGGSS